MPRKKDFFKFSQEMGKNVLTAIQERFELMDEFINEFQQSDMMHFMSVETAPNVVQHWAVVFFKHFAICIYHYVNNTNNTNQALPTRPAYSLLYAGDTKEFFFWQAEGQIPPRTFEEEDFVYSTPGTTQAAVFAIMEETIKRTYFNRRTNTWEGLGPICNGAFTYPPEEGLDVSYGANVKYDNLITNPDDSGTKNVKNLFKFWFQMKTRYEAWESRAWKVELVMPPEIQTIPESVIPTDQVELDDVQIQAQRSEAIIILQNSGFLTRYTVKELLDNKAVLYDFRTMVEEKPPLPCADWEKFPGFHMEFYQGNSYFIPMYYSIDEGATMVYSKAFNVHDQLIIRRAVRNTTQENNTRALQILEDVVSAAISMGFSSAAGALAGKVSTNTYVSRAHDILGGTPDSMKQVTVKQWKPNYGVSIIGGILGSAAFSSLVDFGIEASDRTWYTYWMGNCAAYGKSIDYVTASGPREGSYIGSHKRTSNWMDAQLNHLHGKLWDEMIALDVDQNKYAQWANQLFEGQIEIRKFPGATPWNVNHKASAYEFINTIFTVEVALGFRAFEVRGFGSQNQGRPEHLGTGALE